MADRNLYDEDILAWSDQQAAALRRLATLPGLPNELDLEHIAEEIEDVGHGELRDAQDLLQRVLVQLVVSRAAPNAEPDWQWTGNVCVIWCHSKTYGSAPCGKRSSASTSPGMIWHLLEPTNWSVRLVHSSSTEW